MDTIEDFIKAIVAESDLVYNQKTIDRINKNRRQLENVLFFDRLLLAIGIEDASKLYPPRSIVDLRNFFNSIAQSTALDHLKSSLLYYVLKDLDSSSHDAASFATERYLPIKYQTFVDGIFALDKLDLENAVENLTDPGLVPTFPEEILYTLCKQCKENTEYPLTYYHAVMPPMVLMGKTLDAFFDVMCKASVTEAFYFARTHDNFTHCHLFERLISFVHGASGGNFRAVRASELIGLPFNEDEELWFEDFLIYGRGSILYGAKDTIVMRRIVMGRTLEAAEISRGMKERKIDGLNWNSLTEGLHQSIG